MDVDALTVLMVSAITIVGSCNVIWILTGDAIRQRWRRWRRSQTPRGTRRGR